MKRVMIFLGLLFFVWRANAQIPADAQKQMQEAQKKLQQLKSSPQYQKAMQKAQQAMQQVKSDTSLQRQMSDAKTKLNQLKKDRPELANTRIPDLNNLNAGVPNIDSLSASLSQQMNNVQNKMEAMKQFKGQFKPEAEPLHHTESLPALKKTSVIAFTQATLKNMSPKLDLGMKVQLDKLVKDSTLNVAGTGLFYLSLGLSPREATAYLICKGILLYPDDPYAINALGVYCRDNNDVENALKLFQYADALLPDSIKSPYIYANIGWASFYYGDFAAGQKYFDKSLAISSEFMPALEGEAMIAYAKGDIKALYECLGKELMANIKSGHLGNAGGGGNNNSGPSDFLTDIAATEYIQSVQDFDHQPDPTQDHSFDNYAVEEPDDGADDGVDVSYKVEAKPIFNVTPKTLDQAKAEAGKFMQKAAKIMVPMAKNLTQQLSGLTPLASVTTMDKFGTITFSKSYRKYVDIIAEIHHLFDRRVYWFRKKYNKEYHPFPLKENTAMKDKIMLYFNALEKCGKEYDCASISDPNAKARCEAALDRCQKQATCTWYPVLYGECNSDIETSARIWNKYWDNIFNTIQWYINTTNPLIRKVHDAGWNSYLNNERITYIRQTVLGVYCSWAAEVLAIPEDPLANAPMPSCPPVEVRGVNPPDPFSRKPKHIKEFADPNCKDMDFPIGIAGSITENCHYTKITIGPKIGPIQLGFTYTTNKDLFTGKVKDDIYSKNNDFDHGYGATAGIAYKFDDIVEVDASAGGTVNYNDKGKATGYTGSVEGGGVMDFGIAKLGGKASRTYQFDGEGNITGYSNSLTASGSIGGNASIEGSGHVATGGTGNIDYNSTSNYDASGNYTGGGNTATVSVQQSATTHGGNANAEDSGQTSVFGIQFNQVIQSVAGAKQAAPAY